MKKRTLFMYVLPVVGLSLLGSAAVASAQGFGGFGDRGFGMKMVFNKDVSPDEVASMHAQMFEKQASLLGISVNEVKAAWASGKSLPELAKEKGISVETLRAKMEAEHKAQMKTHLAALVSKGVITQAQADERQKFMETMPHGGMLKLKQKGGNVRVMHQGMGFGL